MWREPGAGRGVVGHFKDTQAGARCVLYDPVGRAASLPVSHLKMFPQEDRLCSLQGGRPRVPICSSCSPAENSVLAKKGFPKTPSALVFLTEAVGPGSSRPSSCSPEAGPGCEFTVTFNLCTLLKLLFNSWRMVSALHPTPHPSSFLLLHTSLCSPTEVHSLFLHEWQTPQVLIVKGKSGVGSIKSRAESREEGPFLFGIAVLGLRKDPALWGLCSWQVSFQK